MWNKILIGGGLIFCAILLATCMSQKTQQWSDPLTFNHELSAFPLRGTHAKIPCESCHVAGQYRETSTRCQHCHAGSIAHADDVRSECRLCHDSASTWTPVSFNHGQTRFQLREKHAVADCFECHQQTTFAGLTKTCTPCHQDAHNGAFGFKCEVCHNAQSWQTRIFDHNLTTFRLTGRHVGLDCEACHTTSGFRGTPKDCYACHQKDSPPNHFGPNCETCHSTSTWKGAVFVHTFPIDRGPHQRTDCQDCHTVKDNFKEFSCISGGCHPKAKTDQKHQKEGVSTASTAHGENASLNFVST